MLEHARLLVGCGVVAGRQRARLGAHGEVDALRLGVDTPLRARVVLVLQVVEGYFLEHIEEFARGARIVERNETHHGRPVLVHVQSPCRFGALGAEDGQSRIRVLERGVHSRPHLARPGGDAHAACQGRALPCVLCHHRLSRGHLSQRDARHGVVCTAKLIDAALNVERPRMHRGSVMMNGPGHCARLGHLAPKHFLQVECEEVLAQEVGLSAVHKEHALGSRERCVAPWARARASCGGLAPHVRARVVEEQIVAASAAALATENHQTAFVEHGTGALARGWHRAVGREACPRVHAVVAWAQVEVVELAGAFTLCVAPAEDVHAISAVPSGAVAVAQARRVAVGGEQLPLHAHRVDVPELARARAALVLVRAGEQDRGRPTRANAVPRAHQRALRWRSFHAVFCPRGGLDGRGLQALNLFEL